MNANEFNKATRYHYVFFSCAETVNELKNYTCWYQQQVSIPVVRLALAFSPKHRWASAEPHGAASVPPNSDRAPTPSRTSYSRTFQGLCRPGSLRFKDPLQHSVRHGSSTESFIMKTSFIEAYGQQLKVRCAGFMGIYLQKCNVRFLINAFIINVMFSIVYNHMKVRIVVFRLTIFMHFLFQGVRHVARPCFTVAKSGQTKHRLQRGNFSFIQATLRWDDGKGIQFI